MVRSVILSASNSCFVACPGCYNHFGDSIADTTAVIAFVTELRQRIGLEKITVGGGDPLTRSDIVDLLAELRALELRIHLDTVGTAFLRDAQVHFMGRGTARQVDPAAVARLVELLGIPLDGSTDEIFRRFRRFSSVTEQEKILTILDTVGAAVCVNTVVHQGNVTDLERIASLILQHPSVHEWQLFQFMPIGPLGHRNRARFEISEEVFSTAVNQLNEVVPSAVRLTPKTASRRKNRYLLIDSAGVVWIPRQHNSDSWRDEDTNGARVTVGTIFHVATLDRITEIITVPTHRN